MVAFLQVKHPFTVDPRNEPVFELRRHLLPDGIAARACTWTDVSKNVAGGRTILFNQYGKRALENSRRSASPSGMNRGRNMSWRVNKEYRNTIGDSDGEIHTGHLCHQCVTLRVFSGKGRVTHRCTMNLSRNCKPVRMDAQCPQKQLAVLDHVNLLISNPE